MPAYNSSFFDYQNSRIIGNIVLIPFCTKFKGPCHSSEKQFDMPEEVIQLFRANSLFKNFEIKSYADRLLIYGILFLNDCLSKLNKNTKYKEGCKILNNFSVENFSLPGEVGFPLNNLYQAPQNKADLELLKSYLLQFRQELASRFLNKIYKDENSFPDKHWLSFSKKKFMNITL